MADNIESKIKEIIVTQLNVNEEQLTSEASILQDLGADSLDTVELIMAFEEEFKDELKAVDSSGADKADAGEIPEGHAEKLQTVSHVVSYVNDRSEGKVPAFVLNA